MMTKEYLPARPHSSRVSASLRDKQRALRRERTIRLNKRLLTLAVALGLICGTIYMFGVFDAIAQNRRVRDLQNQIDAETQHRQKLEIALEGRMNSDLTSEAVNRLGMVRPGSWSVRVVSVDIEDTGVLSRTVLDTTQEEP